MEDYLEIKIQLHQMCINYIEERNKTIEQIISSNKNDLLSETKSSAGDKHETGRAMIQLEMEKAGQQLASVNQLKEVLSKIDIEKCSKTVSLGSLVITNKATYFLAVSIGKFVINANDYFVVSTQSPIGKQLLGKNAGAFIPFNGAQILKVV